MKITKSQFKKIIKEEISKELEDWELKGIKSGEAIAAANTPEAQAAFKEGERKDFLVGRILELWPTPEKPAAEQLMGQSVEQLEGYLKSLLKQSELEEIIQEDIGAYYAKKKEKADKLSGELAKLKKQLKNSPESKRKQLQKKIKDTEERLEAARFTGD